MSPRRRAFLRGSAAVVGATTVGAAAQAAQSSPLPAQAPPWPEEDEANAPWPAVALVPDRRDLRYEVRAFDAAGAEVPLRVVTFTEQEAECPCPAGAEGLSCAHTDSVEGELAEHASRVLVAPAWGPRPSRPSGFYRGALHFPDGSAYPIAGWPEAIFLLEGEEEPPGPWPWHGPTT